MSSSQEWVVNTTKGSLTVHSCLSSDVDIHFQKVEKYIPSDEHESYKANMHKAVIENTAFCTANSFFYYIKLNANTLLGVSIFGKGSMHELLPLVVSVYYKVEPRASYIHYHPHSLIQLIGFKSVVTKQSIEDYRVDKSYPLRVPIVKLCDIANSALGVRR